MRRNFAPSQRKVGSGFTAPSFLGNVTKSTIPAAAAPPPSYRNQAPISSDTGSVDNLKFCNLLMITLLYFYFFKKTLTNYIF